MTNTACLNDSCRYFSTDRDSHQRTGTFDVFRRHTCRRRSTRIYCQCRRVLIVAFGRGNAVYQNATNLLEQPFITPVPPEDAELWVAASAHQTYGRGRHPAGLNFGDTFAYALASTRSLPLLFKGEDFARTDIAAAV